MILQYYMNTCPNERTADKKCVVLRGRAGHHAFWDLSILLELVI